MLLSRTTAQKELKSVVKATEAEYHQGQSMPPHFGITGSTFRAYRNCEESPSKIYRQWVTTKGFEIVSSHRVTTRQEFASLHKLLVASFERQWGRSGCRPLSLAEKHKVVDLFTKAIAFSSNHPCEDHRVGLYNFANVPLDKFSLAAIGKLFYGIVVSDNPSMGNIRDLDTYDFLQSQIFHLTSDSGLPNLVFDYYAWNMTH